MSPLEKIVNAPLTQIYLRNLDEAFLSIVNWLDRFTNFKATKLFVFTL